MSNYPPPPPYPPAGYPPPPPGYPPPTYVVVQPPPPPSNGGCCSPSCCLGCLVVVLIGIIGVGVAGYYAYQAVANAAAQGVRELSKELVKDAQIPQEQKDRIAKKIEQFVNEVSKLDKLYGRVRSGKFSEENVKRIAEKVMKSPIVQGLMVEIAKGKYVQKSGLSDAEKAQADQVLRRVVRGLADQRIDTEQIKKVLDQVSSSGPDGERDFHDSLSDDQLREFLKECNALADNAGIPDNAPEPDLATQVEQLVDEIMQELD